MDTRDLKDAARKWIIGIWDRQDFGLLETMGSPDYVYKVPGNEDVSAAALPEYVAGLRAAFSVLSNTIEEQVAEENVVVSRGTTRAKNDGPFGDLPATGNSIELPWVIITRFEQGRISEDWEIYNEMTLLSQLGVSH